MLCITINVPQSKSSNDLIVFKIQFQKHVLHLFLSAALGEFMHPCEDDIVCKCTTEENKVPYFNAPVYLENKEQIGKVDEIFGQLRNFVSLVSLKRKIGRIKVFFVFSPHLLKMLEVTLTNYAVFFSQTF